MLALQLAKTIPRAEYLSICVSTVLWCRTCYIYTGLPEVSSAHCTTHEINWGDFCCFYTKRWTRLSSLQFSSAKQHSIQTVGMLPAITQLQPEVMSHKRTSASWSLVSPHSVLQGLFLLCLISATNMSVSYLSCCVQAVDLCSQTRRGETENSAWLVCSSKGISLYTLFPLRGFSVSNLKTEDIKDNPGSLCTGWRLAKLTEIDLTNTSRFVAN